MQLFKNWQFFPTLSSTQAASECLLSLVSVFWFLLFSVLSFQLLPIPHPLCSVCDTLHLSLLLWNISKLTEVSLKLTCISTGRLSQSLWLIYWKFPFFQLQSCVWHHYGMLTLMLHGMFTVPALLLKDHWGTVGHTYCKWLAFASTAWKLCNAQEITCNADEGHM